MEEDRLPIFHAEWLDEGIRYTQTVLLTRLRRGQAGLDGERAWTIGAPVLMVRLAGRNTNAHYQVAQVTMTFQVESRTIPLFMEGRRVVAGPEKATLCAVIDGQVQGRAVEEGGLRFSGDMPPGTDGFMVIKIPLSTLDQPEGMEALEDLDFEDEFRRLKRFWRERENADKSTPTTKPE